MIARRLAAVLVTTALALSGTTLPARAGAQAATAVIESRVIGHSVKGRPIVAYRVGDPGAPVVLLVSGMHGDESRPRLLLRALRDGAPIHGVDLWLVPSYNPDGLARHSRRNAHGVDLNRNYPYKWKRLGGSTYSGKGPASEPETRAMMGFLDAIRPSEIVSFHQPLHGVDVDTKNPAFARRLARALRLPTKRFECGGACTGTMTMWFNHTYDGGALTAEYGGRPSRHQLRKVAPRRLLPVLGGHY